MILISKKLLLSVTVLSISLSPSKAVSSLLNEAQSLYKEGNYEESIDRFYRVYASGKADEKVQSVWFISQALIEKKLYHSSVFYLTKIIKLGAKSKYFRQSISQLERVNDLANIGFFQNEYIFKEEITAKYVAKSDRDFFYFNKGILAYKEKNYSQASELFSRVTQDSNYFVKSRFYLGVISTLLSKTTASIKYFQDVIKYSHDNEPILKELATLNIARVYYEMAKLVESIEYYSQIPRESENWLQALFEASWAFFLLEKPNNTLGNIHTIHSPFFTNRHFPETYILEAFTYFRFCMYDRAKLTLTNFKKKYIKTLTTFNKLSSKKKINPRVTLQLTKKFSEEKLKSHLSLHPILDQLVRSDVFLDYKNVMQGIEKEMALLDQMSMQEKIKNELKNFLTRKKIAIDKNTGNELLKILTKEITSLKKLDEQAKLIEAELMLGKINVAKAHLNISATKNKKNFIGGMKNLEVGQELEYWPFTGEYWFDELGSYVYNLNSQCRG